MSSFSATAFGSGELFCKTLECVGFWACCSAGGAVQGTREFHPSACCTTSAVCHSSPVFWTVVYLAFRLLRSSLCHPTWSLAAIAWCRVGVEVPFTIAGKDVSVQRRNVVQLFVQSSYLCGLLRRKSNSGPLRWSVLALMLEQFHGYALPMSRWGCVGSRDCWCWYCLHTLHCWLNVLV